MEVDETRLEKFSEIMKNSYSDETFLGEAFTRTTFDEDIHADLNFFQIGENFNLPKKFFSPDGQYNNGPLAEDFAKSVYLGERDFLLKRIVDLADNSEIPEVELSAFTQSNILSALNELDDPTDIFIPLFEELHRELLDWADTGGVRFEQSGEVIVDGEDTVRIHWVPLDSGLRSIVVVDTSRLEVVQKEERHADMDQVDIVEEYDFTQPDDLLMIYYGESDEPEEFQFLFRTVISEPVVDANSACVIGVSNLELDHEKEREVLPLNSSNVDNVENSVGIYKLFNSDDGPVRYVGMSENLKGRLRNHIGEYRYFEYEYKDSTQEAYRAEAKLFHKFSRESELDNDVHPPSPEEGISCPVCDEET